VQHYVRYHYWGCQAALTTMLKMDDNVSLMTLETQWREQMDIVLPTFAGATPRDIISDRVSHGNIHHFKDQSHRRCTDWRRPSPPSRNA
jgi:hypothetical protein